MKHHLSFAVLATVFTLNSATAQTAVPNDSFALAATLTGYSLSVDSTTLNATLESGEFRWADNRGGHSIWYAWTAPEDGTCTLSGTGPGSGLLFTVYVGSSLGGTTNGRGPSSLRIVAENAFASYGVPTSFHAVTGTKYMISVDGFMGEQGPISFTLQLGPSNDGFVFATSIYGDHYATIASNHGATRETGEPDLGGAAQGRSVWWNWTAPASGSVTLNCASTNMQPVAAAYTGLDLTNLTLVALGTNSTNGTLLLQFNALAGTTYQITVDGSSVDGTFFSFELTMDLLRITSPLAGQVFPQPANLRLSAQVPPSMPGINMVEFLDQDTVIAAVTNAPFSATWQNTPTGSHILRARGVDASGNTNISLPVPVLIYTNQTFPTPRIAAWELNSYVIDALGNLYLWGMNGPGFFGLSGSFPDCPDSFNCTIDTENILSPQIAKFPPGITGWKSVSGSAWMYVAGEAAFPLGGWALSTDGRLYQYGLFEVLPAPGASSWRFLQDDFMLDDLGRVYYQGVLRDPQGPYPWKEVIAGYLISSNGAAYVQNGTNFDLVPFPEGVTSWTAFSCGGHCLALGNDRQLYAWGYNYSGQLGLGDNVNRTLPTLVPPPAGVTNWVAIAAGGNHSLAIADNGQLYAWGRNWENQLGAGYTTSQTLNRPAKVVLPAGVTQWTMVAAHEGHSLAIGDDCQLYAWGDNAAGDLGIGTAPAPPTPARVAGLGPLCGIPSIVPGNSSRLPNGNFLVEFPSDLNRAYNIQYSSDMQNWNTVFPSINGTGARIQWIDDGPPKTDSLPGSQGGRFYRVVCAR